MTTPGGPMCVAAGGVCTSPSDCCPGYTCNISSGSLQGTCGQSAPPPPPPPPADGGPPPPPPPGMCATSGQTCKTSADCCYGSCDTLAGTTCTGAQTGCTCQYIIP
jgi:hypothetical protein